MNKDLFTVIPELCKNYEQTLGLKDGKAGSVEQNDGGLVAPWQSRAGSIYHHQSTGVGR